MNLIEKQESILANPINGYYVQFISSDIVLDSGISLEFNSRYNISQRLMDRYPEGIKTFNGWRNDCIFENPVFNLVIKEFYYDKPTYANIKLALQELRTQMYMMRINVIHIPAGSGTEQMDWNKIKDIIRKIFSNTTFTVIIYYGDSNLYERPVIEIYPTHIELSPFERGDNFKLEKQFSKWNIVRKRYYPFAYTVENKKAYFPRGTNIQSLQMEYPNAVIVNRTTKYSEIKYFPSYEMTCDPRDNLQKDIIQFLEHQGRYSISGYNQYTLSAQTDSGKTFCACSMMVHRGIRSLVITHQVKIKEQWIDTLKEKTTLPNERIIDLEEDEDIFSIINCEFEGDIFVITHQKINSFVKKYTWEKFNDFLRISGIGIKIYDEAHLFFEHILNIDFFTNVKESYYLTATFTRSDPREAKMFRDAFSASYKWEISNGDEKRKHVVYCPIIFNSRPGLEIQNKVLTRYGFSAINYIDYAINLDPNKTILSVLQMVYDKIKDQDGKTLIVSPTISSSDLIASFMKQYSDGKNVVTVNSKMDKKHIDETIENSDIVSSTIKSSGTGVNIKGLRFLFCLEPHSSQNITIQLVGRLREYDKTKYTFMFDFFDLGFPQMMDMYENHIKAMKPRVVEIRPMKF
nr:MAG TPA: Cas system-associated protein [Caudoviricetes sp.]